MSKEAEIKFLIKLDDSDAPEQIYWDATESKGEGFKPCDSLMVSMWDRQEKNTMSIDLWTNDMEVGEMNSHYYFTLMKMADTYEKATRNKTLSQMIRDFAGEFAEKVDKLTKRG